MTGNSVDPYWGMDPEEKARAVAAAVEAKRIAAKREAAARRLQAPPGPAKAVKAAWAPVRRKPAGGGTDGRRPT